MRAYFSGLLVVCLAVAGAFRRFGMVYDCSFAVGVVYD